MRGILCFFIFIAVVGVGLSREIGKTFTRPSEASAVVKTSAPPEHRVAAASPAPGRTVRLDGDSRGHFQVDARIDGRPIELIVDTGASLVVINESSAARLGIFPKPSDYTGRSQTANGEAKFAPVRLNRIEVNGITVFDVQAAVKPDSMLRVNLLGMSFLSRVKWSYDRGRLVLEQ
jgi:aspartyl protease family protein